MCCLLDGVFGLGVAPKKGGQVSTSEWVHDIDEGMNGIGHPNFVHGFTSLGGKATPVPAAVQTAFSCSLVNAVQSVSYLYHASPDDNSHSCCVSQSVLL